MADTLTRLLKHEPTDTLIAEFNGDKYAPFTYSHFEDDLDGFYTTDDGFGYFMTDEKEFPFYFSECIDITDTDKLVTPSAGTDGNNEGGGDE